MRFLYFFCLTFLIAATCKRKAIDDLTGDKMMDGRLFIQNPYDSFPPKAVPNHEILLQKETALTPASFIVGGMTDGNGKFSFNNIHGSRLYKLYSEIRSNTRYDNDVLFSAVVTTAPAKDLTITMIPDTMKQNGLFVICRDTVTQPGPGIIPRDSIYIYASKELAQRDSAQVLGVGAQLVVANMDGKALKMNLSSTETLYINTACTYGSQRYVSKFNIIKLRKTGIDTLVVKLIPR